ncbi:hypothetical protein [Hydrogenophaga sp. 2FB]|uniref:DarT1-associated NADAR antitoxin family protein n=1 Tax=Hydrogenophaga sp. 2FB TaxID=2502187 RepID=UPI001BB0E41E|nr:hypothetical protein [Hydrogenophaga sp. 2FB]
MAERPVFAPGLTGPTLVRTWDISFSWSAGMSVKQAQKSIDSLHEAAKQRMKVDKVLEISSKSKDPKGVRLSAFNLMIKTRKYSQTFSVECAYQSAKVFERGGPYKDLREKTSREAKLDPRLKTSGDLVKFQLFDAEWGLEPKTAFYDWLYINALHNEPELAEYVLQHRAFSDIAFNPERSLNCQAYSAALYVALHERDLLSPEVLRRKESYLEALNGLRSAQVTEAVNNLDDPYVSARDAQPDFFARTPPPVEVFAPEAEAPPPAERKQATINRAALPATFPTQGHPPEFWEQLGRTIAAFGFLEETLGKAIFAFTATTEYSEDDIDGVLAKWNDQLQHALTDTLIPLVDVYANVVRQHQDSDFANLDELVEDIKKVATIRNALCHGSWRQPDSDGRSQLYFFNKKVERFDSQVDVDWLRKLQANLVDLISAVINSVTVMGWQFPGGAGPGEKILMTRA